MLSLADPPAPVSADGSLWLMLSGLGSQIGLGQVPGLKLHLRIQEQLPHFSRSPTLTPTSFPI